MVILSNGDDGYKLVKGTEDSFVVVDLVADLWMILVMVGICELQKELRPHFS